MTAGYFEAMRIPVLHGRTFTDEDRAGAPSVVVVNELAARQLWPGEDAIGQRVILGDPLTVIGVVGNIRHMGPGNLMTSQLRGSRFLLSENDATLPRMRSLAGCRLPASIVALLVWTVFGETAVTDSQAAEKLRYRGRKYAFDSYKDLFGDKRTGELRRLLFEPYLERSDEGRRRAGKHGAKKPEEVWRHLAIEEKASFLAITAALGNLQEESGVNLLEWIESLEEIHGETRFPDGRRFMNNEAFRIYVKLQPAGMTHVLQGSRQFRNLCTKHSFGYDGLGTRHPDFCRPNRQFEAQRSTDNYPHVHFNFTASLRCVDIDIDYRKGLLHLTRDNSNVLVDANLRAFRKEFCDPGFRRD